MASSRRNLNVEALRLAAIAAIALFHSFQTLFAQAASAAQAGAVAGDFALGGMVADPAQLVASTPWALGLLGFINLMGAFGNNVFYAISGCFLIPSAARRSRESGYASDQLRRTARRALVLLATVVFYACAALAVNAWVVPVAGVGLDDFGWLVGGLEFIWVYLVLVIATPMMGWVWERCPHRTALVVALGAVVMGVNAYIAFVSPGGEVRSLLEWRKLMSAVTYVVAYLAGAVVAQTCEAANAVERDGARRVRRAFALAFAASLGASLVIEGGLAVLGAGDFMVATSFKSTSLLSFALAVSALGCALSAPPRTACGPVGALVAQAAQGIVAFYIIQSMFGGLWHPLAEQVTSSVMVLCGAVPVCACAALIIAHLIIDLVFIALALLLDAFVRRPLFRLLRLA